MKCPCLYLVILARIVIPGIARAFRCQDPAHFILRLLWTKWIYFLQNDSTTTTCLVGISLSDQTTHWTQWWSIGGQGQCVLLSIPFLWTHIIRHIRMRITSGTKDSRLTYHIFFNQCVQVFIEVDAQTAQHTITPHVDVFIQEKEKKTHTIYVSGRHTLTHRCWG